MAWDKLVVAQMQREREAERTKRAARKWEWERGPLCPNSDNPEPGEGSAEPGEGDNGLCSSFDKEVFAMLVKSTKWGNKKHRTGKRRGRRADDTGADSAEENVSCERGSHEEESIGSIVQAKNKLAKRNRGRAHGG